MRICTQCGHKLAPDEFLCPACELWDSKSYTQSRSTRRQARKLATVFIGPFEHAMLVRQLCESSGIPAFIDAERGAKHIEGAVVRVQVPEDRVEEAAGMLSRKGAVDGGDDAQVEGPGLRQKRSHLRARLSLRRRAYQALAWAIVALVLPPAGLWAGKLALSILAENRGLPVVTEETRVATAALVISTTAMVLCAVVTWLLIRGLR